MNSSRPYLIRALYEWIEDNGLTPYILVDATGSEVDVPRKFIDNGRIILNISYDATHNLVLGDESVSFNARFSGSATDVSVPISNVLAIYARENGQGMMFGDQEDTPTDTDGSKRDKPVADVDTPALKKPRLTIVK